MRKYCLETGHPEPTEKSINETFSHQVNYARRKFKRNKLPDISSASGHGGGGAHHHGDVDHHDNEDSYKFNQSQCQDGT